MKDFIPYEQALELKVLGFDEPCFAIYYNPSKELFIGGTINPFTKEIRTLAPLYQQAFRWFREKHTLGAIVSQFGWGIENEFGQIIHNISDDENPLCYEEAELACLNKLIEIVKNGKQ